jgi:hypothetical protein
MKSYNLHGHKEGILFPVKIMCVCVCVCVCVCHTEEYLKPSDEFLSADILSSNTPFLV